MLYLHTTYIPSHPQRTEEDIRCPRTTDTEGWKLPCECRNSAGKVFAIDAKHLYSNHQHPCKKSGVAGSSYNPSTRSPSILEDPWPSNLAICEFHIQQEIFPQKTWWRATETPELDLWPLHVHVHTCACTHPYMPTPMHAHTHTQNKKVNR